MEQLATHAKRLLPKWVKGLLRFFLVPKTIRQTERELGTFVLEKTRDFSMRRGGRPESLQSTIVRDCILHQKCLSEMSEAHQYLQTALMPHYEQDLYEYYRQQQYLILLVFLSYAFRGPGCLASHIEPYIAASSDLSSMRILDYGAGLAFGLIHLMRTCPGKVDSITIVDLDLIHTDLVEYILSDFRSDTEVTVMRVTKPETIPDFGNRTFNLIYGKDVFEHLTEPERHLRSMLARAEDSCHCYFDFNDHGATYLQHVHPQLSHLHEIVREFSFRSDGNTAGLSKFLRAA
jgi:hypothetical protein